MSPSVIRHPFVSWFLIGTAFAALIQFGQARSMGGAAEGLLFVGSLEPAHQIVLEELPNAPVSAGMGHDGQIFYAIALDPGGVFVPDVIGSAGYRYRRILYPLLASVFGTLEGQGLLWGMIAIAAVSMGLAAGAVAGISRALGLPAWSPLAVLFNPGMWLSARLLTSDGLAFAFSLLAIWAFVHKKHWLAIAGVALAALTKEPYLAFAIGLGGYTWFNETKKEALRLTSTPLLAVGAWWTYVGTSIDDPLTSGDVAVLPMWGLINAVEQWPDQAGRDIFYMAVVVIAFVLALYLIARRWDMWSWLVFPWILIALITAEAVWQFGNNTIRAFTPVLTLSILGVVAHRFSSSTQERPLADSAAAQH